MYSRTATGPIGETNRTLKVRLGEYKQAVRRGDLNNGIAAHTYFRKRCCRDVGDTIGN